MPSLRIIIWRPKDHNTDLTSADLTLVILDNLNINEYEAKGHGVMS